MTHPTSSSVDTEWLPVANSRQLGASCLMPVRLAGQDLVLWRGADHAVHAWLDRCPHRGAKLSLGRIDNGRLVCAYHGWEFGGGADGGQCVRIPASPAHQPSRAACATRFDVQEKYGVIWVCLGTPAHDLEAFPEYERPGARHVHLEPQEVRTSAPRLVENFMDMAHFPFVHAGTLGQEPRTEVKDYLVQPGPRGPVATQCLFWQPLGLPTASGGAEVEYVYSVRGPMLAALTKLPLADRQGSGSAMHILLAIAPIDECHIRAWLVAVFDNDTTSTDEALYRFNLDIFLEDVPIVESQQPKWLPLDVRAEAHQRCDKLAMAYRRWLTDIGWTYGTSASSAASRSFDHQTA